MCKAGADRISIPASERFGNLLAKILRDGRSKDLALFCSRPRNPYLVPHLLLTGKNLRRIVSRLWRNTDALLTEIKIPLDSGFEVVSYRGICRPRRRRLLGDTRSACGYGG